MSLGDDTLLTPDVPPCVLTGKYRTVGLTFERLNTIILDSLRFSRETSVLFTEDKDGVSRPPDHGKPLDVDLQSLTLPYSLFNPQSPLCDTLSSSLDVVFLLLK